MKAYHITQKGKAKDFDWDKYNKNSGKLIIDVDRYGCVILNDSSKNNDIDDDIIQLSKKQMEVIVKLWMEEMNK